MNKIELGYIEPEDDDTEGIIIFRRDFKKAVEEMEMLQVLSEKQLMTTEASDYYAELRTYIFCNINSYLENRYREI